MRLVTLAAILATCRADLLNTSYLPPASAKNAGGSDGAIAAPAINRRTQDEQLQRQSSSQDVNNNNQYQTQQIKPVFNNQISSNANRLSNNEYYGTNLETDRPLNSYGESINESTNNPLIAGDQREDYTRQQIKIKGEHFINDQHFRQPQGTSSMNKPLHARTNTSQNITVFDESEYRKNVQETFTENNPNSHEEKSNRNGKPSESGASILRLDKQMASDAYSYSFETENGISAGENAVLKNGVQTQGGYSYTGDDGQVYSVSYVADESGYRPIGSHLPTPPPVPEEILKSIEDNARAKAAGRNDDGFYHEQNYNTENIDENGSPHSRPNSEVSRESSRSYLPPIGVIANKAAAEDYYHIINNESSLRIAQPTSGEINSLIHSNVVEEASKMNTNLNGLANANHNTLNENSRPNLGRINGNNGFEKTNKIEENRRPSGLNSNDLSKTQVDATPSFPENKDVYEEKLTPHAVNPTDFSNSNAVIPFPTLFTPKQQLTTPKEDQRVVPIEINKPKEQNSEGAQNIGHNNDQVNKSTQPIHGQQSNDHIVQNTLNQTISVPTSAHEYARTTVATVPVSSSGYHYNHPQAIISSSYSTEPNIVQNTSPVSNGQINLETGGRITGNKDSVFGNAAQVHSDTYGDNQRHNDGTSVPKNPVQQQVTTFQLSTANSGYDAQNLNQLAGHHAQFEQETNTFRNVPPNSNHNYYGNTEAPRQKTNHFIVSDQIQPIPPTNRIPLVRQHAEPLTRPVYSQNLQNAVSAHGDQQDKIHSNFLNQFTSNPLNRVSFSNANAASEANRYSALLNIPSGNLIHTNEQPTYQGAHQAVIANSLIRNSEISAHNNNEGVREKDLRNDNYVHRSNLINNIAVDQNHHNDVKISVNHPHAAPTQNSRIQPNSLSNNQIDSAINRNIHNQYQNPPPNTFINHNDQDISRLNYFNQDQYVLTTPQVVTRQPPSLQKFTNNPPSLQRAPIVQTYTKQNNNAESRHPISSSNQQYSLPETLNLRQDQNGPIYQGYIYNSPVNPQQGNLIPTIIHNNNEYRHQNNLGNAGLRLNTDSERSSYNNIQINPYSNQVYTSQLPQQRFISVPQSMSLFNQNQDQQKTLISNQTPQTYHSAIHGDIRNLLSSFRPTQPTTIVHHGQHPNQQPIDHNDNGNLPLIKVNSEYDRSHNTVPKSQISHDAAIVDYNTPRQNQQLSHTSEIQNSNTGVSSSHLLTDGQYSTNRNNPVFHAAGISAANVQGSTSNAQGSRDTVPEQFSDHRPLPSYNPVTGYRY